MHDGTKFKKVAKAAKYSPDSDEQFDLSQDALREDFIDLVMFRKRFPKEQFDKRNASSILNKIRILNLFNLQTSQIPNQFSSSMQLNQIPASRQMMSSSNINYPAQSNYRQTMPLSYVHVIVPQTSNSFSNFSWNQNNRTQNISHQSNFRPITAQNTDVQGGLSQYRPIDPSLSNNPATYANPLQGLATSQNMPDPSRSSFQASGNPGVSRPNYTPKIEEQKWNPQTSSNQRESQVNFRPNEEIKQRPVDQTSTSRQYPYNMHSFERKRPATSIHRGSSNTSNFGSPSKRPRYREDQRDLNEVITQPRYNRVLPVPYISQTQNMQMGNNPYRGLQKLTVSVPQVKTRLCENWCYRSKEAI